MMMCYFLQEDYDGLNHAIQRKEEIVQKLTRERRKLVIEEPRECSQSCCGLEQDLEMYTKQLQDLQSIRSRAVVVSKIPNDDRVTVGKTVQLKDLDGGKTYIIQIGSYMVLRLEKRGNVISYMTDFARAVMCKEVGDQCTHFLEGKRRKFVVTSIHMRHDA